MSYMTVIEFVSEYTEREARLLTDLSNSGSVDTNRLTDKLQEASDMADGYLGRRYYLPLSNSSGPLSIVPSHVRRTVGDIARYLLTGTQVNCTDDIRNRYKDALNVLQLIADGKLQIGADVMMAQSAAAPTGGAIAARTSAREFGDETLRGMM